MLTLFICTPLYLDSFLCHFYIFQEVKHEILFLVEMLEPLLDPAIAPICEASEFVAVSSLHSETEKNSCDLALDIIRVAVGKPAVLPFLESEWRRNLVAPR